MTRRLRAHRMWSDDSKPRSGLTIMTHLSMGRLDQLQAQCDSWPGPLTAAVYLVLPLTVSSPAEAQQQQDLQLIHEAESQLDALSTNRLVSAAVCC